MVLNSRTFALAAALVAAPLGAWAQEGMTPAPVCTANTDAALPAALQGWNGRADLAAAANPAVVATAALPIGKGVNGQLKKTGEVSLPVLPAKPGGSVSYSGLYRLNITEPGDYQVSLGSGAWIEVVAGKVALESTAHAPGPACSSLRKTVVYPLKPGRYLLEIAGNGEAVLPVMVHRVK